MLPNAIHAPELQPIIALQTGIKANRTLTTESPEHNPQKLEHNSSAYDENKHVYRIV